MTRAPRPPVFSLVLAVGALWLLGCGGSAGDEARKLETSSVIARRDPVPQYMVSTSAIERAPRRSAERAFLSYWSNLQFQAWSTAAQAYEPDLRHVIGDAVLVRALANQAAVYRASRPEVSSTTTTDGRTLIRYFRVSAKGRIASSSTWTRATDRRWLISFDPLLDGALAELRQLETQQAIAPLAQKPIAAAIRAANEARKIQSRYVQQRDRGANPVARGGTGG
jgi:hypothetical protein